MKNLINLKILNMKLILYKKIYNLGLFSQNKIKNQLGFSLIKEQLYFIINIALLNNYFFFKIYFSLLEFLLIDIKYYKKMSFFFNDLFENKLFLKKNLRLKMGLPVNGQRSKTNAQNSRKRFYLKFLN